MPNIAVVLKSEIARISRKEARAETESLQGAVAKQRKEIVELKRQVVALEKAVARLLKSGTLVAKPAPSATEPATGAGVKFSAAKLLKHRQLLGITANEYGALVGASGQSVYKWEAGKAYPRARQLQQLGAVLAMGKREFLARTE